MANSKEYRLIIFKPQMAQIYTDEEKRAEEFNHDVGIRFAFYLSSKSSRMKDDECKGIQTNNF